ncbi:hypothetical protein KC19_2G078900 [Ceratodon purpureus]|uniref:Uncharacterized protein n=1 Tax=Ceratodon purpureus TaxID=3225 RepID=A0A8T0IRC9_CERPU|nr:hypothetical protein KC19_2G078900 [Ceratodon purpureus]
MCERHHVSFVSGSFCLRNRWLCRLLSRSSYISASESLSLGGHPSMIHPTPPRATPRTSSRGTQSRTCSAPLRQFHTQPSTFTLNNHIPNEGNPIPIPLQH